jgi:hypothetical protein
MRQLFFLLIPLCRLSPMGCGQLPQNTMAIVAFASREWIPTAMSIRDFSNRKTAIFLSNIFLAATVAAIVAATFLARVCGYVDFEPHRLRVEISPEKFLR